MADDKKPNESDYEFAVRLEQLHDRLLSGQKESVDFDSDQKMHNALQALLLIQQVKKDQADVPLRPDAQQETKAIRDGLTPSPAETEQRLKRQRIGRFELHEMIGKGGYGRVFRARDQDVDRMVALKIPRVQVIASPELETRFIREAKAAGALSHPNIVTVYEAGRDQEVLYIASQLVDGVTLAQWLANSDALASTAQIAKLISVLAGAIQHAHDRGVLHRDLTPANVLLANDALAEDGAVSNTDSLDHPMIADFGLAKLDQDQTDVTQSGMIVGTPAYMAPEQMVGAKDVVLGADVYGLGAIMYELITGRKPFVGTTILELIKAVKEEPPIAPVRLRADVPRDLEAICLMCLEKEPASRYSTAGELETDLLRFLNAQTVVARPVSSLEHFRRWTVRNPALSKSLLVLTAVVLVALAATLALLLRSEYHRGVAQSKSLELSKEVSAKETALQLLKTRSSQMKRIIDRLFIAIADSPEIRKPENEQLRRRLISEAEEVYASFLKETPGDQEFLPEHAELIARLARLFHTLGEFKKAEQLVTQAINEYQQVGHAIPDSSQRLAVQFDFRSSIRFQLGNFNGAENDIDRCFEALPTKFEDTVLNRDTPAQERLLLAKLLSSQASNEARLGNLKLAREMADRAHFLWIQLREDESSAALSSFDFWKGSAFLRLGQVEDTFGNAKRMESLLTEAITLLAKVDHDALTEHLGARVRLSQCQWHLGIALTKQHRLDEARKLFESAIEAQSKLNQKFPNVELYADAMGSTAYSFAVAEYLAKNYQRAEELLRENVKLNEQMILDYPDTEGLRWSKIGESNNLIYVINCSTDYNHIETAEDALVASIKAQKKSLELRPDSKDQMMRLSTAEGNWGRFLVQLDRLDDAKKVLDSAHDRALNQLVENPEWEALKRNMASIYDAYFRLYIKLKDFEKATGYCEKHLQIRRDRRNRLANFELAWLYAKTNRFEKSEQVLDEFQRDFCTAPMDYVKCANSAARIALAVKNTSPESYDYFLAYAKNVLVVGYMSGQLEHQTYLGAMKKQEFLSSAFSNQQLEQLLEN